MSLEEEYKKDLKDFKKQFLTFNKKLWVEISGHKLDYPAFTIYAIKSCCLDKARVREVIEKVIINSTRDRCEWEVDGMINPEELLKELGL